MNRCQHPRCELRRQHFPALTRNAKPRAEERLGCGRAHGHDQLWLDDSQLCFQPGATCCNFARIRFLMNPAFPARLPLKMFHRVRDINLRSIDSSFFERLVHDFPGWPDERFTGDIFIITRLFADEHHRGTFRTFTKNRLRRPLVKMTSVTILRCLTHGRPAHRVGWPRRSRKFLVVGSHATIMNRNSRAIRLHYFLCRLLKPNG